ncbi:MAG TPA: hypothetical protein VMU83_03885, partial [Hanamia sp.]|nr:hypothetical protein [Hanamia sp.]
MKKNRLCRLFYKWTFLLILIFQLPTISKGQSLKISDFVLFGGSGTNIGTGCSFFRHSSPDIQGGSVGGNSFVKTSTNATINGNIYSGGFIQLANNNSISGNITSANSQSLKSWIISGGNNTSISGNIDVNGNTKINSGKVNGIVTHPSGTYYLGPTPGGGNITGTPNLPILPALPDITNFPTAGNNNIYSSQILTPGAYGNISIGNNQTITLSGTGIYIFNSIKSIGNNNFVFDFKNDPSGTFKIYVYGDVDLNKVNTSTVNGGDATRIYSETHGNGSSCSFGRYSWNIANIPSWGGASSNWLGTVWAPYGGINLGSGSGQSTYTGAFYSGTQVNIQNNVTINYAPFIQCSTPVANAGSDKVLDCSTSTVQLDGTASTPGLQYSWAAIDNGKIISDSTTLTPTVNAVGGYVLTVTNPNGGCSATDTALVTFSSCILPYYPPPASGKIKNLIGAELNSLALNFGSVSDSTQDIFILKHDSVIIDVIALQGQYQTLLSLLQTPAYGMTNLINNGPNTLIISGEYPINHLLGLDSLTSLIDYCRPIYPSVGNVGIVTSQGDIAIQSYLVRGGYGLTGEGVKVGVISNSYNTLGGAQTDVLNGDLPGVGNPDNPNPVEVLKEYP